MHDHGKRAPSPPTFKGDFTEHWLADSWIVASASALTLGFAAAPLVSFLQWRILQREIYRRGLNQDVPAFLRWVVGTAAGSLVAAACVALALLQALANPSDALTTTLDLVFLSTLGGAIGGFGGGVVAGILQRSALVRGLAWILPAPERGPWMRATARGWAAGWAASGFSAALAIATARSAGSIAMVPALVSGSIALAAAWYFAAQTTAAALLAAEQQAKAQG